MKDMEQLWRRFIHLFLVIQFIELCNCLPIYSQLNEYEGGNGWEWSAALFSVIVAFCAIVFIIGCLCCQTRQKGFQEFTNASVTASEGSLVGTRGDIEQGNDPGLVNPIAAITSGSEFTIFRPLSPSHHNNNVITTAPQTSINQTQFGAKRITEANFQPNDDVSDWFDETEVNFPRNKLKYLKELGRGWFGRVIIGEAALLNDRTNTQDDIKTIPVVVRALDAAAGSRERAAFLREARIYYKTAHANIMPLHGKCLDVPPLLLIQPYYDKGDLKKYLREHENQISDKIFLLRLCWELTNALEYLYHRNISHPDLALRNCILTDQMSLCLGDYGHSSQVYPEDYYPGTPPVPVRWCAPENVVCTSTTIQPKPITCAGNVWSLGIVLWEIISCGKQPYASLSDDDVVTLVLEKMQTVLNEPQTLVSYSHNIYQLSRLCCSSVETRPLITQVQSMLSILLQNNDSLNTQTCEPVSDSEFLSRWNSLKPNTIVKTDNHSTEHSNQLKIDISHVSSSDKANLSVNSTVTYDAKQLSPASTINSDCFIAEITRREKSLSLTNLHGSLENLITPTIEEQSTSKNPFVNDKKDIQSEEYESWLENIASQNTEDLSYVKGLSQAMQELDSALALEKSSSSSDTSHQPSPGPESWVDQQKVSQNMPKIDFKLGPMEDKPQICEQPNSQPDSLLDSILNPRSNSGSETEDETWKKRIERGAYSEKVRIKSKSVADLMVLTHIDTDTDSETTLPSLDYKTKQSFKTDVLSKSFGSEGNINVVHDTFQEELRKLQEARRDSLLFVPVSQSTNHCIESQNRICDGNDTIPSLNVINASDEDLSIIQDLDFPVRVFLQRKETSEETIIPNGKIHNDDELDNDVPSVDGKSQEKIELFDENRFEKHDLIPRLNFIQASMEDLSNLDDLDIPLNVFVHTSEKPVFFKFKDTSGDIDEDEHTRQVNTPAENSETVVLNKNETNICTENSENVENTTDRKENSTSESSSNENVKPIVNETIDINSDLTENNDAIIESIQSNSNSFEKSLDVSSDFNLNNNNKNQEQQKLMDETKDIINFEESLGVNSSTESERDFIEMNSKTSENLTRNSTESLKLLEENSNKTIVIPNSEEFSGMNSNTESEREFTEDFKKIARESFVENPLEMCSENTADNLTGKMVENLKLVEETRNKTVVIPNLEDLKGINSNTESEREFTEDFKKNSQESFVENPLEMCSTNTADNLTGKSIEKLKPMNEIHDIPKEIDLNNAKLSPNFEKEIVTSTPFKPSNQIIKPLEDFNLSNDTLTEMPEDIDIPKPTARNIFDKTVLLEKNTQKPLDNSDFSLLSDEKPFVMSNTKQFLENEKTFVTNNATFKIEPNFDEFLTNIESNISLDKVKENNPELMEKVANFNKTYVASEDKKDLDVTIQNLGETFVKTDELESVGKTGKFDDLDVKESSNVAESDIIRLEKSPNQEQTKIIPNSSNSAFKMNLDTNPVSTNSNESDNSKTIDDLKSHTIDLAQTVTNLVDGLDCTIPNRPPEFNVMRFEIIPQFNFENSNVILGPCDDYTLDLYTGLKTTYVDDNPSGAEEEMLQFSTNFSSLNEEIRSNENSDMFLSKVPPITPDLSSIITPCDSLEEHAMNTTFALKHQAENIVNNIIKDAKIIVCGKIEKYDFVPEVRDVVDEIIYKAECFVSEKNPQSLKSDYFEGSDTIETPQLDSLEFNANSMLDSSSSVNKTVILKPNELDNTITIPTITKFDSTYTLNEDVSGYSLELGWFLHPSNNDQGTELPAIEGTIEDLESPPTSDNSYVGFSLDEECVTALRNELAAKLPHAQGPTIEPDLQEDWECEPGTSEQHDEVILRYNVFAAPLSPIAEESEEFDCPTPETTPCREDSDSDCEWSGACFDGGESDTRTPRAGSPNAAGRRSSRHRHTPSMDSCCSNDTLFNIEDLTGVPGDPEHQKYNTDCDTLKNSPEHLNPDECDIVENSESGSVSDEKHHDTTQEISKTTILMDSQEENRTQLENTEAFDGSDVYPSSTERIEAEPSTQEINSDYFSPTRNDFLSQEQSCLSLETKSDNQINSLKMDRKIITEKFIENESKVSNKLESEGNLNKINSANSGNDNTLLVENNSQLMVAAVECTEDDEDDKQSKKSSETYTMSDILQHLEDTPPVTNTPPKLSDPVCSTSQATDNFLDLNFEFKEELPSPKHEVKSLKTIASESLEAVAFLENHSFLDTNERTVEKVQNLIDTCQKTDSTGVGNSEIFYVNINETIPINTLDKISNPFLGLKEDPTYANIKDEIENSAMENELQFEDEFGTNENMYANLKNNSDNANLYANVTEVCNFYANLDSKIEPEKKSNHHNSFDDDSVLKFYENIPASPVHDDKIIESLYENIGKVNNGANMEKLFAQANDFKKSTNIYENTKIENDEKTMPTYHKLYENIEKSKDFPYENKLDAAHNDSVENSQSENGHHDSDDTYDKVYAGESEDLYSDITDIRFSGPCDAQLMSTSFSDPHGGSDDQDWDSGSESRSSSSGEFVWKEGEHEASVRVLQAPTANDEENIRTHEDHLGLSTPDEDSCSTSSGEDGDGVEFIPSAWDSQAAPIKSAMRSPDKTMEKCERKRGVWFKKQKYHCVYEYPREPDFSPTEWNTQPYTSSIWGTPTASDLSSFADWELDTENMIEDGNGSLSSSSQDLDVEEDTSRYTRRDYFRRPGDLYRLADVVPDIDFATGLSVTDDDFYVTSTSKPFQSYSSQFFPGQLQFTSSTTHENKAQAANVERANSIIEFANDLKKLHSTSLINDKKLSDLTTPDSGVEDITPASMSDHSPSEPETEIPSTHTQISSLKALAANSLKNSRKTDKVQDIVMGGLRHTRDKLKLDLPPSPTSFSANKAFNLEISSDTSCNSHREREPPTFTTFGKTRFSIKHVDTPTEELDMSLNKVMPMIVHITSSSTDSNNSNTDTNSPDAVDLSQPSDCDSAAESLLLESKRRSIEIVRGEASLLDSADEDSGIESSANATLERESVVTICTDKSDV